MIIRYLNKSFQARPEHIKNSCKGCAFADHLNEAGLNCYARSYQYNPIKDNSPYCVTNPIIYKPFYITEILKNL